MKRAFLNLIPGKVILMLIFFQLGGCKQEKESFNIAFLTDIHLQPELNAVNGLTRALDSVNRLNPDFIITGGDLIMDALAQSYGRADSLYRLYDEVIKKSKSPGYNTMGNHELYGIYERSGADTSSPDYGEKMFERRLGESYYSIEHKGWKFFIINSIEDTGKDKYTGLVDAGQMEWIKDELAKTDPAMPLVISTHIPFITAFTQKYDGSTLASDSSIVVSNSREVLSLFKEHNLKLVLQGHLHTIEDIHIDGIHFITGGAVSAGWWKGPNKGFEEGFLDLTFYPDDFTWRYVDYGWEVKK